MMRILCLAAALLAAGSLWAKEGDALPEVPAPELGDVAAPVRSTLLDARASMVELRVRTDDPVALANGWINLGDVYFAHEFMVQAEAAWNQARTLQPTRSDLLYRLGVLATLEGDSEVVIRRLDAALEQAHPDVLVPARIRRGLVHFEAGNLDAARGDFQEALRIRPDSAAALGGLGRVALAEGLPDEAVELLEQALAIDPTGTQLYFALGNALRRLGRVDEAREALVLAGEGEPAIDDPLMMQIQQRSRSPQYYLEAGLAYAERGDFISAVGLLRQAGMLSPRDPAIISAYGRALARAGEYELARDALRRLRELGDMSADDWVVLGQVEARTGSFDEALGAYAGALTLDPDLPAALEGRARVRLHQGNTEAAVLAFADLAERAAAAERPDERARLLYWQAMSHLAADDCQQASTLIQEAFDATEPPDAALLAALARMRATCLDAGPEALNEAMEWSEQIYDARPGLESAVTLAMVLAAQGRFRDAVDVQAAAIFEALKSGELDRRPDLQANMRRYEAEQRAERPFPADDPRFRLN